MEELRECIKIINENFLKGKHEKVVFWKNCDNSWSTLTFHLHCNKIHAGEKSCLEFIQKCDPKAVIVDVDDFVEANGDGSILVDDMVNSVLYLYGRGQSNINDFLDYYAHKEEQEQTKPQKVNQKILKEVVKHCWDNRLWKERFSKAAFWKIDECWNYHMFCLPDNILPREEEVILKGIKEKDCFAVIIDKNDYSHSNEYAIPILMEADIFKYSKTKNTPHNIVVFLAKYGEKVEKQDVMTIKEIVEIMEKRLKQLADYEYFELSNGNSTSTEMLEIAKFLIGAKKQGLGWEE